MDREAFFSGYCRCQDQSRTVTGEIENGRFFADCSYGSCPYESSCQIAENLRKMEQEG